MEVGAERGSTVLSFRELYTRKGLEIFKKERGPTVEGWLYRPHPPLQPQSLFPGQIWMGSGKGCRFVGLCLGEGKDVVCRVEVEFENA